MESAAFNSSIRAIDFPNGWLLHSLHNRVWHFLGRIVLIVLHKRYHVVPSIYL